MLNHIFVLPFVQTISSANVITYKLLLFVSHQLGDLVLAGRQLLLVVSEIAHDKLLFASVQLEFLHNLRTTSRLIILTEEEQNTKQNANIVYIPS